MAEHYLSRFFEPRTVAVFGASERADSTAGVVFRNLLADGFQGRLFAINPRHRKVHGKRCYKDLGELRHPVDLAIIATPAATVPGIIDACGDHGVHAAMILSAGFGEPAPRGVALENSVIERARRRGVRLIGPNCLGIMRPHLGLNATFTRGAAIGGSIALVSQSGAICSAILDWASASDIGFSTVVSLGVSVDVDFGEVLDYLVYDSHTQSILLYIEDMRNARSFMSALRAAARVKPVIALKVGRHPTGKQSARTGALVSGDDVFEAAVRRAGVVRGYRIGDLFSAAATLASGMRASGERLAVITNGGGPGIMAADHAADIGIPLAELSAATRTAIDKALHASWSRADPVDINGNAPPEQYAAAVKNCLADPAVDGILVLLTPQAMTDPSGTAEAVIAAAGQSRKPLLACWMGESQVAEARERLRHANIPVFRTPEAAVAAFAYLRSYYLNQKLLLQTPGPLSRQRNPDTNAARLIIEGALAEGRKTLGAAESKAVLHAFHVDTAPATVARSASEALVVAENIGFPVAMKANSPEITRRSEIDGVKLNIGDARAVRDAYEEIVAAVRQRLPDVALDGITVEPMLQRPCGRELLAGLVYDPVFGPVVTFGAGGANVEVLQDRAVSLPPLNRALVRDLIGQTRVSRLLRDSHQPLPANMTALEDLLLRISEMACDLPEIRELEINPLIVDEQGALAVDTRIVVDVHPRTASRYGHMAIHPYPAELVSQWRLTDGTELVIRPIRPEDAEIERAFILGLSERAKYFRFMQNLRELPPQMLARFTQIDYEREMALIAVVQQDGDETEIGVARYVTNPDGLSCEFAIVVSDQWQRRGIGRRLMERLMDTARSYGIEAIEGDVLANNTEMLMLARKLGFGIHTEFDDPGVRRVRRLL